MMQRKMIVEFDVEFDETKYTPEFMCKFMHDYMLTNRFVSNVTKSESFHPRTRLVINQIRLPKEVVN